MTEEKIQESKIVDKAQSQKAGDVIVEVKQESQGLSVASLVLGIFSIFLFWVPFVHFIIAVLAIMFGIIGSIKKQGIGIAGLILGVIPTTTNPSTTDQFHAML